METIKRLPTHPGDVLKEELESRSISQKKFAELVGVPYTQLNEILNGKRPVSTDFALMMEAALGISPELLINMQNRYNMALAKQKPALWTEGIVGEWQDTRSTEQILQDIHDARTSTITGESLCR